MEADRKPPVGASLALGVDHPAHAGVSVDINGTQCLREVLQLGLQDVAAPATRLPLPPRSCPILCPRPAPAGAGGVKSGVKLPVLCAQVTGIICVVPIDRFTIRTSGPVS
jgi:hypothetical protein